MNLADLLSSFPIEPWVWQAFFVVFLTLGGELRGTKAPARVEPASRTHVHAVGRCPGGGPPPPAPGSHLGGRRRLRGELGACRRRGDDLRGGRRGPRRGRGGVHRVVSRAFRRAGGGEPPRSRDEGRNGAGSSYRRCPRQAAAGVDRHYRGPRRDADPRVQHLRGARLRRHRRDRGGVRSPRHAGELLRRAHDLSRPALLGRRYHPVARSRAHGHRRADRMAPHSHPYLRESPPLRSQLGLRDHRAREHHPDVQTAGSTRRSGCVTTT